MNNFINFEFRINSYFCFNSCWRKFISNNGFGLKTCNNSWKKLCIKDAIDECAITQPDKFEIPSNARIIFLWWYSLTIWSSNSKILDRTCHTSTNSFEPSLCYHFNAIFFILLLYRRHIYLSDHIVVCVRLRPGRFKHSNSFHTRMLSMNEMDLH